MSMKMKGLLKGLRYISTIFDEDEQQEMQIGFPTDVRHVAHIGWDGSTANSPSWINTFKTGDSEEGPPNGNQQLVSKSRGRQSSTGLDTPPLDSPSRRRSDKAKGSRRTSSVDSPKKSSLGGQEDDASSSTGSKLTARRKKPKSGLSSGQSSSRTSTRSKHTAPSAEITHFSDPGIGGVHSSNSKPIKSALGADRTTAGRKNKTKDTSQSSALKVSSEQDDHKSLDDISRGIHSLR